MQGNYATLTLTVIAAVAVQPFRGITIAGAVPAVGGAIAGFTRTAAAAGEVVPVDAGGTVIAETGGAIAVGAAVEVDAQGRVVTASTGTKVGRMAPGQPAATAAGQFVELIYVAA